MEEASWRKSGMTARARADCSVGRGAHPTSQAHCISLGGGGLHHPSNMRFCIMLFLKLGLGPVRKRPLRALKPYSFTGVQYAGLYGYIRAIVALHWLLALLESGKPKSHFPRPRWRLALFEGGKPQTSLLLADLNQKQSRHLG